LHNRLAISDYCVDISLSSLSKNYLFVTSLINAELSLSFIAFSFVVRSGMLFTIGWCIDKDEIYLT
jgi:hypothetical protein